MAPAATARAWLASALLVCSLASAGARTQRDIAKKTAQMTEEDWRRVEEEWETLLKDRDELRRTMDKGDPNVHLPVNLKRTSGTRRRTTGR